MERDFMGDKLIFQSFDHENEENAKKELLISSEAPVKKQEGI